MPFGRWVARCPDDGGGYGNAAEVVAPVGDGGPPPASEQHINDLLGKTVVYWLAGA